MTFRDVLNRLPQPYRNKAIGYTPSYLLNSIYEKNPSDIRSDIFIVLSRSFTWSTTPEGHVYWKKIATLNVRKNINK